MCQCLLLAIDVAGMESVVTHRPCKRFLRDQGDGLQLNCDPLCTPAFDRGENKAELLRVG
eukprot:924577-Rhodomonas_salina.1